MAGQRARLLLPDLLTDPSSVMTPLAFQRRWLRQTAACCLGVSATLSALLPQLVKAHPWPIQQTNWNGSVQDYPSPPAPARPWWRSHAAESPGRGYGAPTNDGSQPYGAPPLTPEQQAQRCNTGRLIGGLGGGAVAYAMSRDNGRAWAIPLGALLGSQVGCNTAAGRGLLPW
jgi:hypothetical protein